MVFGDDGLCKRAYRTIRRIRRFDDFTSCVHSPSLACVVYAHLRRRHHGRRLIHRVDTRSKDVQGGQSVNPWVFPRRRNHVCNHDLCVITYIPSPFLFHWLCIFFSLLYWSFSSLYWPSSSLSLYISWNKSTISSTNGSSQVCPIKDCCATSDRS